MGIGIEKDQQFNIFCNLFEDNAWALALAKLKQPRMTSWSKHYAVKHSLVWSFLKPENIQVLKIELKQQSADIFTICLAKSTFEYIQELLMGW